MSEQVFFVDDSLLDKVPRWRNYLAAKLGFRNHWYPVKLSNGSTVRSRRFATGVCTGA
jgi:carbazole 1,9a-dioxygenase terminal dioxygenase component